MLSQNAPLKTSAHAYYKRDYSFSRVHHMGSCTLFITSVCF